MKKYLFSILLTFLFLLCSGCGKADFQLSEDQYYLCSTNGIYDAGTILLDNHGEIVKSFPNMYVSALIDTEGHVLDQYAGTISKDMILFMCRIEQVGGYLASYYGVYRVGESDWVLEPTKSDITYSISRIDFRFSELQIDDVIFNNKFEIVDEFIYNETMYYGKNGYHTQVNATCSNVIVDQNENLVLDADKFYQKNKSIVPYLPEDAEISLFDLINEDCMIVEYSYYEINETSEGTLKQPYITYWYFCSPDGTLLRNDLYYTEYFSIRRESSDSYDLKACASKKYLRGFNDYGATEYLKVEGKDITKLHLPDTDQISFVGNGFYLIRNGDDYTIYDGEEDKETVTFTSTLDMNCIHVLGQNSYLVYGIPDTGKGIELHLILSGKEIPTYEQSYDEVGDTQTAGQYSIFHPLNSDRKSHTSYITDRSGECIYKTDKNVIWVDDDYMLILEDNMYYIYDRNENLIKESLHSIK